MKAKPEEHDVTLADAIAAVRDEEVPAEAAKAAAARVGQRLAEQAGVGAEGVGRIEGCADVLALLPAYRAGALPGPRALLVSDHLGECAACRAAHAQPDRPRLAVLPWRPASAPARPERSLGTPGGGPGSGGRASLGQTGDAPVRQTEGRSLGQTGDAPVRQTEGRSLRRYAAAASVLLAVGLASATVRQVFFAVPPGSRAAVQSVSGRLQLLAVAEARGLTPGEEVGDGEAVRTATGSQAVLRLSDGSLVEMGERAELSVSARGRDTTIRLLRGNIIVQAAKRRTGHLLVASDDCTVSVTGTVFSVNRSVKGSRVSVIEGEVRVAQASGEKRLHAGDQLSTSAALGNVPLAEEIAWSRDRDRHLALLGELAALRQDLRAVHLPELRYESRLLRLVPEDALVYASLPNYGEALGEGYRIFEERLEQSPILRDWWQEMDPQRHGGPSLDALIGKVRGFAGYLGDEVVFTAIHDGPGRTQALLLAEVRRPGLREFLERELGELQAGQKDALAVRILDDDGALRAGGAGEPGELFVLLRSDLIAIAPRPTVLRELARHLQDGSGGLDQTAFGQRIAEAYHDGVGLLFGANLERVAELMSRHGSGAGQRTVAGKLGEGIEDVRHLIVERKDVGGRTISNARLTFAGERRGIASWLGTPAPMGALDFVSSQATAAGAFVVKSPAVLLQELLATPGQGEGLRRVLAESEARLNVRLREDVIEALGGEFAFALDGPLLPTPSWKVVIEVYDPARLQAGIQALVAAWNEEAAEERRPLLRLEAEQAASRTYYALRAAGPGFPIELHYAFEDGYLVAAPSRALVMRAIQVREGGEKLTRSARFQSLFTADGHTNMSAMLYQNLGPLMNALVEGVGSVAPAGEGRETIAALARSTEPTLLCAYGEEGQIQVAGLGGLFDLDPGSAALPLLLGRLIPGTPAGQHP